MSFAETIALASVAIAFITFAGISLEGYKRRLDNRERELELKVRLAEADAKRASGKGREFEDRLRVLERIATDRKHALAAEIDALGEEREYEGIAR